MVYIGQKRSVRSQEAINNGLLTKKSTQSMGETSRGKRSC